MIINHNSLYSGLNTKSKLSAPEKVTNLMEESLFEEAINTLRESNNEIRNILSESYSSQYINEKADISFTEVYKKITDTFGKSIDKLYQRFKLTMVQFNKSSKVYQMFSSREKDIQNYKEAIKFDFPIYNYTCLDADIPPANLNKLFKTEFDEVQGKLKNIAKSARSAEEAASLIRGIYTDNKKEDKIANIRRIILKGSEPVTATIFANELFMKFRDNNLNGTKDIVMNGKDVYNKYYIDYIGAKDSIKIIERDKKNIIESADDVYKAIKNNSLESYNWKFDITNDMKSAYNTLMNIEASTIFAFCQEIVLAYGVKLDAVKENYRQDIRILAVTLKQIIKEVDYND